MKYSLLIATFLLAFIGNNFAQQSTGNFETQARTITEQLAAKYHLTDSQIARMQKVQERKLKNTAEIETLKTTDREKYYKKMQSLQKGTLRSIQAILSSKEQKTTFSKTQAEVRQQKAAKRKELIKQGMAPNEIEKALSDIYAE
jgi:exopolysaccharide biosynthesis protein